MATGAVDTKVMSLCVVPKPMDAILTATSAADSEAGRKIKVILYHRGKIFINRFPGKAKLFPGITKRDVNLKSTD